MCSSQKWLSKWRSSSGPAMSRKTVSISALSIMAKARGSRSEQLVLGYAAPPQQLPQHTQGFHLDLPHALAGDLQFERQVFQRAGLAVVQAETALDHPALLVVELGQPFVDVVLDFLELQHLVRQVRVVVGDRLAERQRGSDVERCVERGDPLVQLHDATDVLDRMPGQRGDVVCAGIGDAMRFQMPLRPQVDVEFLDDVYRQTDGARLVHDRALDVLAYPPGGIGRETETALGIEFLQRMDEAEVAFFHQVEQRRPAVGIMLG